MTPLLLALDPARALTLPPPAAGSAETLDVIVGLFVLLLAAKVGEEIFRRLGQPGVIGELAGGFVVGPYALGLVVPGETATVLAEIGVVILLFAVGLEIKTDQLLQVGRPALVTAVLGVVFPIAAGVGLRGGRRAAAFDGRVRRPRPGRHQHRDHEPRPHRPRRPRPAFQPDHHRGGRHRRRSRAHPHRDRLGGCRGRSRAGHARPGRRRDRVRGPRVRRRPQGARRAPRGVHLAALRRHADRARLPGDARARDPGRLDRPRGDHRRLRGRADRRRDGGAGRDRARDQAARRGHHAVLLRRDRRPAGPRGPGGSPARPQRGRPRGPGNRHQGPGGTDRRARCRPLERPGRGRRDGAAGRGRDRGRDARPRPGAAHPGPLQCRPGGGRPDDRRGPAHAEPGDPASGRRDRGCRGPVAGARVGPGAGSGRAGSG